MKKLLYIILLNLMIFSLFAQEDPVGVVVKVKGILELKAVNTDNWKEISKGQILHNGDQVRTGENSVAAIKFMDGKGLIKLKQNTVLTIMGNLDDTGLDKKLFMEVGNIWVKATTQENEFLIETPTAVASIKGSEGYEEVDPAGNTWLWVIEGMWEFYNDQGSVTLGPGTTGYAEPGTPPSSSGTGEGQLPDWAGEGQQETPVETDIIQIEVVGPDGQIEYIEIEVGPPTE